MAEISPAFQFYPDDWLSSASVALLSREQEGDYIRLLCYCWREGSIPNDPSKLSALVGKGATPDQIAQLVNLFDVDKKDSTRLIHARLDRERKKQKKHRKERSESGAKGAKSRWDKQKQPKKEDSSAIGSANSSAIKEPIAKNGSSSPSPSPSSSRREEGALPLFPQVKADVKPPKNPSGELKGHAVMLLSYLNEKAGRRFEARDEMLRPIMKRLAEGNPVEEIKLMIDREISVQGGTSKWLQPSTLFGKNFYGHYDDRALPVNSGAPKPASTFDIRSALASKESRMADLKRRHHSETQGLRAGFYVAAGWQDDAAKAEYVKLKAEVKELKIKLEELV